MMYDHDIQMRDVPPGMEVNTPTDKVAQDMVLSIRDSLEGTLISQTAMAMIDAVEQIISMALTMGDQRLAEKLIHKGLITALMLNTMMTRCGYAMFPDMVIDPAWITHGTPDQLFRSVG